METSFVSASPADQNPGLASQCPASTKEEEEGKKKEEEEEVVVKEEKAFCITKPKKGNAHFRLRHLDRLEHGGYFIDFNYYTPFKVNERRFDVKFYEKVKKRAGKVHKLRRKLELRRRRRKARENPCKHVFSEMLACSSCQPVVTLEDKLKEVKLLFGEMYRKEDGEGEKDVKKEGEGEENVKKEEVKDKNRVKKRGGKQKKVKKEEGVVEKKIVKKEVEDKEGKIEELEVKKMEENLDDKKNLELGIPHPIKAWEDIKVNRSKHPLDPSCFGDEIIRKIKIIQKKKPKRRLKVPFTCKSQLPQRLSSEIEDHISQLSPPKSSENVAMVLNIGRQRPLYQEQYDNVKHFENADSINVNWAKFAASAVQTSSNSTKVSRMLIPVLCEKLVKLIKYNDELKMYDGGVEYGIDKKLVVHEVVEEEEEEESKGEEKEKDEKQVEKRKVKRKCVSAVVKSVVAKLVDSVVADEENDCEVNSAKINSQKRVGRELKRLNASYIECEELASRQVNEAEEINLARIEKEYHQTIVKKKDEIIFLNSKNKRLRRRPLKLEGHVLEVCDPEEGRDEEMFVKSRRTDGILANEIKTEEIRQVEASVEGELSNPPVKDCSVQLVKTLNLLEDKEKVKNASCIEEKNDVSETYIEDSCSLPKFQIKLPENVIRPQMFRMKRSQEDTNSPPKNRKNRKIELKAGEKQVSSVSKSSRPEPGKIVIDVEDFENPILGTILKSNKTKDANSESMQDRLQLESVLLNSSATSKVRCSPNTARVLSEEVSIHPAGERKRIKTLKPVRRVEEPEISVKIQSVISLNPEITVLPSRRMDIFREVGAPQGKAVVFPTKVRFLKVPINQQFEQFTHKDGELEVVFGRGKLSFALTILRSNSNNEMVFIPAAKAIKHNEDNYFGVYFHHKTLSKAFVGPYQLDEEPKIYIRFKSDPEMVKFVGDFCMTGDFVISFWKCHNRLFERRICKDPLVKQLAVYVYRNRNQPNSTNQSFLNVSQEADKLAKKSCHESWLNSVKNFRIKPLGENTKNSVGDSPAADTRCKSPDLDIVKMEIDFEDSVNKSNVSTMETENVEMLEQVVNNTVSENETPPNNDLVIVEQTVNSREHPSVPETPKIVEKMVDNSLSRTEIPTSTTKMNNKKTKNKEPRMKNRVIDTLSAQHSVDNLRSFYEYARNLNKLALNNVELSYRIIEKKSAVRKDETAVSTPLKEKDATAVEVAKSAIINRELEIVGTKEVSVEDGNSNKQTNDTTQGTTKEQKIIATIDLCATEACVPVAEPAADIRVAKPNVVEKNATSPVKKQPKIEKMSYPVIGFRRIEPKPALLDQGSQKRFLRIDTSKSILNPLKIVPITQVPSTAANTSVKSILKYNTEQGIVQTVPQEALQQQMFVQATKVGSKAFNLQLLQQKPVSPQETVLQQEMQEKTLIEAKQNASQTMLQSPPNQVSLNLMKLVEEKLTPTVSQQTSPEKKMVQQSNQTVLEETERQHIVTENPLVSAQKTAQPTTNQKNVGQHNVPQTIQESTIPSGRIGRMIKISGNKILLTMGNPLKVISPKSITLQKSGNTVLQVPPNIAELINKQSPTNKKEIGLGKFIKIPISGQNIQIMSHAQLKTMTNLTSRTADLPISTNLPSNTSINTPSSASASSNTSRTADLPISTNVPSNTSINTPSSASASSNTSRTADLPISTNVRSNTSINTTTSASAPSNTSRTADLPVSTNVPSNTSIYTPSSASASSNTSRTADLPVSTNVPSNTSSNTPMTADLSSSANASRSTPKTADLQSSINNTQSPPSTKNVSTDVTTLPTDTTCVRTSDETSTPSTDQATLQHVNVKDISNESTVNRKETLQHVGVLNVSDESSIDRGEEHSQHVATVNINNESTSQTNTPLIEDPDALKIVSNWKYNTKYMQSLGLFVDEEDF